MTVNIESLGISHEQLREMVASKIADEITSSDEDLFDSVQKIVNKHLADKIGNILDECVRKKIDSEMREILAKTIVPVDIWGDPCGKTTTLRDAMHQKAQDYWNVSVDQDGKPSSYYGKPRYQWVLGDIAKDAFDKALKENITVMVSAMKEAIRADLVKSCEEHVNRLIPRCP